VTVGGNNISVLPGSLLSNYNNVSTITSSTLPTGNYIVSGKIVCLTRALANTSAFVWCGLCSSTTPNYVTGASVVNNLEQLQYITFYKYNSN
jgi:hypothetical protein